jgi:hypothetical protein
MVSRLVPSLIKSITLVVPLLTLGATVGAPANSLRADECLAAPDSPSPQGTHWYYRLEWATQRKCWYLGTPDRPLRRAAATAAPATPLHSTPVPFGPRHSADGHPISVDPGDTASPSSRVDMLPVKPTTLEAVTATGGKFVQQSVQEDTSAPPPMDTPVSQAGALLQTGNEPAGPSVTPTARPDPVPAGTAFQAQDPIAIPTNTPSDSASDVAERAAGGSELTNNAGISMVTIFPILALGLAVVGMLCMVVVKNVAGRRARTIIDHRELDRTDDQRQHDWRGDQDQRGSIDERHLILSALSDHGPTRSDDVPFQTAFEIRKRKDKLAQLHQALDRLLQSPTAA